jgi:hypothetical protein
MAQGAQGAARDLVSLRGQVTDTRPRPSKVAPMGVMQDIGANDTLYGLAAQAIELVQANPDAVGVSGYMPNALRAFGTGAEGPNWLGKTAAALLPGVEEGAFTPGATELNAIISDLMSRQLLQRSGAAVTVSEFARIRPYVPRAKDTPNVLLTKLENIARVIQEESDFLRANYGEDQGYFPVTTRNMPNSPAEAATGAGGFLSRFRVRAPGGTP